MKESNTQGINYFTKRQRQHELLVALIKGQDELELMDTQNPNFSGIVNDEIDPARWIDRNRRILEKYQSLVRSAITLDALMDSEQCEND